MWVCGRGCQLVPSARQNWSVAEHLDGFNHKPCSAVVSGMFQLTQLSSHCGCILLTYPLVHTNIGHGWQNKLSISPSVIRNLAPCKALHNLEMSLFSTQLLEETPCHFAHFKPRLGLRPGSPFLFIWSVFAYDLKLICVHGFSSHTYKNWDTINQQICLTN